MFPLALGDPSADTLERRRRDLGGQDGDEEPVDVPPVLRFEQRRDRHIFTRVPLELLGDPGRAASPA